MTLYRVAQHRRIHSCPAFPDGHTWSITRHVVETVESGPCLTPARLRCLDSTLGRFVTVELPCRRRLPREKQCPNCAVTVEVVRVSLHVDQVKEETH